MERAAREHATSNCFCKAPKAVGLGYAFVGTVSESCTVKVIVIPLTPREVSVARDAASPNTYEASFGRQSIFLSESEAARHTLPR